MVQYSIDPKRLLERGRELGETYRRAQPFPHIVIDGLFPPQIAEEVLAEFPGSDQIAWQRFDNPQERKLASRDERSLGPAARRLIWEMNSQVFLEFLEALTGIADLIPDPQLSGGGMHQIARGGKLALHVDFNKHARYGLDRRLNLLLYLNKNWAEEYGGHLELWDRDMQNCVQKILPIFNRIALFSTTEHSWHGHPNPLNCPEGRSRKSLALYYYTNGRPAEEATGVHSTVFRARPGEVLVPARGAPIGLRDFVPPILVRAVRRLRGKASGTAGS